MEVSVGLGVGDAVGVEVGDVRGVGDGVGVGDVVGVGDGVGRTLCRPTLLNLWLASRLDPETATTTDPISATTKTETNQRRT